MADRYNGPGNVNDEAAAIAVDSNGNVVVTGVSYDTRPNQSFESYVTIKYSTAGVLLWNRRYAGGAGRAVAVDSSGNVFMTGYSNPGFVGETIAYSSAGVPLWTNRFNGVGNQDWTPQAIAVDGSGNVFVTGSSYNGTNFDIVTIKYSSSLAPPGLDFQKLNNQLVLSWTKAGFTLQSAPLASGTFTNIPGATSPYTNSMTSAQQYFRLTTP